jgi:hypothetical protein
VSGRSRIVAGLIAALLVAVGLAVLGGQAESHSGHPQKKLFPERWHYQPDGDYDAWMTLSTSDVWLDCDGSPGVCGAKWFDPFDATMADWNSQPMTARFAYTESVRDMNFDVNVIVDDEVPGGPGLLGFAPTYDENGDFCFSACDVYSGIVWVGDDAHSGVYGTAHDRQATLAHELGHIITLRHESVNSSETVLYDCGFDDTGVIPYSIMAYDCIDPVVIGGEGLYLVEPWDACGVNHAYFDPAFQYSGCDGSTATPVPSQSPPPGPTLTPSPTPGGPPEMTFVWGDLNCSGASDPVDSLTVLRYDSGLSVSQAAGCPLMGSAVGAASVEVTWGNVDCMGLITPVDSLKVLRKDAGLSVAKAAGCPDIGASVPVVVPSEAR